MFHLPLGDKHLRVSIINISKPVSLWSLMCVLLQPLYDELKAVDDMLQLSKEQDIARVCIANLEANAAHWQRKEKGLPD